jgi:hypothetical protein
MQDNNIPTAKNHRETETGSLAFLKGAWPSPKNEHWSKVIKIENPNFTRQNRE